MSERPSQAEDPDLDSWDEEDGTRVYLFKWADVDDKHLAASVGLARARAAWAHDGSPLPAVAAANVSDSQTGWQSALLGLGFVEVFAQVEMQLALSPWEPRRDAVAATPPSKSDLPRLWDLNNEVYAGRRFTSVPTAKGLQAFVRDATDLTLWSVVWSNGDPVAFVAAGIREDSTSGVIEELSVHPDYRRNGLGGRLLERALGQLQQRGVESVELVTDRDDVSGARTLYESVGFRETGDDIRYRLPLA